jgi:hypothetical protein
MNDLESPDKKKHNDMSFNDSSSGSIQNMKDVTASISAFQEEMGIADAAVELFNNIFQDIFNVQEELYSLDGNQKQLDTLGGESSITKE